MTRVAVGPGVEIPPALVSLADEVTHEEALRVVGVRVAGVGGVALDGEPADQHASRAVPGGPLEPDAERVAIG